MSFLTSRLSIRAARLFTLLSAALAVSSATAQLADIADAPEKFPKVTERKSYKRAEWAFQQRAFPAKTIPDDALVRGFDQMIQAEAEQSLRPSAAALRQQALSDGVTPTPDFLLAGVISQWVNIGPSPIIGSQYQHNNAFDPNLRASGRVSAIAVDPQNGNRWVIGTAQGGIWVTENAGASWSPKTDMMPSMAIGALRFVPVAPDTIYAGTGESVTSSDAYSGVGLLKSTDGGNSWQHIAESAATFKHTAISEIRVHPSDPQILVVTSTAASFGRSSFPSPGSVPNRGIFKSTNGGVSWSKKFPLGANATSDATDLEIDPFNFDNQFAAVSGGSGSADSGVYRSTNAGDSWTVIDGPWTNSTNFPGGVGRIEMAISPADSNVLYVSIQDRNDPATDPPTPVNQNDAALLGIWKTVNALDPTPVWVQIPTPAGTGQLWYDHQILVDPTDSRVLYFGETRFLKYDGRPGATVVWANRTANAHADQHAIAFSGGRLIIGNDGGVFYRDDRADTAINWTHRNTTLSITQFYDGSIHPTDKDFAIGGAQDNGSLHYTGSTGWNFIGFGDGAANAISNSRPNTDWAVSNQYLSIVRTTAGGAIPGPTPGSNFIKADIGIFDNGDDGANNRAPFIARIEKHPAMDDVFIAGTNNIWRSNNFFSGSSPSWSQNSDNQNFYVTALAFAPSDSSANTYAYGGGTGALRITSQGGGTTATGTAANWKNIDPAGQVPDRYVTDLVFAPSDANSLYVTLSGFDENTEGAPGHVFRTRNALAAAPDWENISPPVNLPVNTITIDPLLPQVIYVGTDLGVWEGYQKNDGTVVWTHMGSSTGMPNVAVYDLKFQEKTRRLFAFTHGRGAFIADLFPPNDHVEAARIIPGASGRIVDTNINATLENGEPDHFPGTAPNGQRSVWFLWQAPSTGQVEFNTIDSNFDTDLAVYQKGSGWNGLALPAIANDDNSGGNGTSKVTFQATAGTLYYIALNGSAASDAGFYALSWVIEDHDAPVITVTEPPHNAGRPMLSKIGGTAIDPSGIQNNDVTFTLYHSGTGEFWTGTQWTSTLTPLHATVLADATWAYTSVPTGGNLRSGQYFVSASAVDRAGNASQPTPGLNQTSFQIDTSPPQVAITEPIDGAIMKQQIFQFTGTASDAGGINRVVTFIRRNSDGTYWRADGTGWTTDPLEGNLQTTYNAGTASWNCIANRPVPGYPPRNMPNGSYNFIAIAFDQAGNQEQTDSQIVVDYHRVMTWEGGVSGDWANAANWQSSDLGAGLVVPDDSAIVVVNNGLTVSSSQDRTVYSVRLLNGRIQFTNPSSRTLTTLKTSTWSGGSFGGTWNVAEDAVLEFIGEAVKHLSDGSILNNYGTIRWGGPGSIQAEGNGFVENPVINNRSGASFIATAGGTLFSRASFRSGTPVFNNEPGAKFSKVQPVSVAALLGVNLVQNPGAESGGAAGNFTSVVPPEGWTTEGSFSSVLYSIGGPNDLNDEDSAAVNGGAAYFAGGPGGSVFSSARQRIDLSAAVTQIDTGRLSATLSGFLGGYLNQPDTIQVFAVFLDELDVPIAFTSVGPVSPAARGGITQLIQRDVRTNLPSGTRTVQIEVVAHRQEGEYNDGYADNLKFEIGGSNTGNGPLIIDTFAFNNSGEMHCEIDAIAFNTSATFINPQQLTGNGRFELQGGFCNLTGNLILQDAIFRVDQGDFNGAADSPTILTTGDAKFEARGGRFFGQLTVSEGSKFLLTDPEAGPTPKFFGDGFVLNNYGLAVWSGGGQILAEGNSFSLPNPVFNNKSTGRFEFAADGTPFARASGRAGDPVFNNEVGGQLKKTAGDGTLTLNTFFINNAGDMICSSGLISWNTTFTWNNATALQGPGTFEQKTGRLEITGSLGVANDSTFTILGGDIYSQVPAGVNLVSPLSRFRLRGGSFFGHYIVPADSFLELSDATGGALFRRLNDGLVLDNFGTITWLGGAPIEAEGNSYSAANPILNNKAGGRFEIAADGQIFSRASGRAGVPVFNNELGATFVKTAGAGSSLISIYDFLNRGNLVCNTGVFTFNTNFDFSSIASLAGDGGFEITGGTISLDGPLAIGGGTLILSGGIYNANANGTATLTSTGNGKFIFQGGEYRGKLSLSAGSRLEFADPVAGPAAKFFQDGAIFDNYGTVVWAGGGKIQANGFSHPNFVFNNKAGGRFEIGADGELFSRASSREGQPLFNNEPGALINKYAAPLYSEWTTFKFNNSGGMSVQSGGFRFLTDVLFSNAAPLLGAGCFYEMRGGRFDLVGDLNAGNSTFTVIGNNMYAGANAALVAPAAGRLRFHAGGYFGTFKVPAGSFLDFADETGMNLPKYFGDGSVFNNEGTVTWRGPGTIQAEGNSYSLPNLVWNNKNGSVFDIAAAGTVFSRASFRDGVPVFNNQAGATIRKTVAGDALFDTFALVNEGQILCDAATLAFNTSIDLNTGSKFAGAGLHQLNGGIINLNAEATTSSTLSLVNSDVRGNNTSAAFSTTGAGVVRWLGGIFRGTIGLTSNSRMDILDRPGEASVKFLVDGTVLNNNGIMNWSGDGPVQAEGNGFVANPVVNNNAGAVFNAAPTGGIFNRSSYRDGTPVFTNAGTVNIGAALGIMRFEGWNFAQTSTGRLNLELGGTNASAPQYDQLLVDRNVVLDGTVGLGIINGFGGTIQSSDIFDIIKSNAPITTALGGTRLAVAGSYGSFAAALVNGGTSLRLSDYQTVLPTFDNWAARHGLNGTNAGPNADPNGNGISNLLEYALGLDPTAIGGPSGTTAGVIEENGEEYQTLSFTRPRGANTPTDIIYTPERTSSLKSPNWSSSIQDIVSMGSVPGPGDLETVMVRSTHPMSSTREEYLHLKVTPQ